MGQLDAKVAVVTGAASGIGLACVTRLASEGAKVAITARSPEGLQERARVIEEDGGHIIVMPADLGNPMVAGPRWWRGQKRRSGRSTFL